MNRTKRRELDHALYLILQNSNEMAVSGNKSERLEHAEVIQALLKQVENIIDEEKEN